MKDKKQISLFSAELFDPLPPKTMVGNREFRRPPEDMYEVEGCQVLKETDKALLVDSDLGEVWIPKSQICENSEVYAEGTEGSLIVTGWLAKKLGWL